MPMIEVKMFPGRSHEQKTALVRKLTEAFVETCGSPGQTPHDIWVVIDEISRDNWAVGGQLRDAASTRQEAAT